MKRSHSVQDATHTLVLYNFLNLAVMVDSGLVPTTTGSDSPRYTGHIGSWWFNCQPRNSVQQLKFVQRSDVKRDSMKISNLYGMTSKIHPNPFKAFQSTQINCIVTKQAYPKLCELIFF